MHACKASFQAFAISRHTCTVVFKPVIRRLRVKRDIALRLFSGRKFFMNWPWPNPTFEGGKLPQIVKST